MPIFGSNESGFWIYGTKIYIKNKLSYSMEEMIAQHSEAQEKPLLLVLLPAK